MKVKVVLNLRGHEADDYARYEVQAVATGTNADNASLVPEETEVWLLTESEDDDPCDFIEPDRDGSPLTGETLAKWIRDYGEKAAFRAFQTVEMYPNNAEWVVEAD
jgi:hypothetical protein